ncbi:unnamed protein product [Didymodactylos carnosus]|nr:unnamed protein product [Didymodactylos carnosus]CAF3549035.1 unnamed protein product [Didymodactylos carnosus]
MGHYNENVYSTYDSSASPVHDNSISTSDGLSESGHSTSSSNNSMYEQICYDTVKLNNSKEETSRSVAPYAPYPQIVRTEQQQYQIPYPDYSSEDERPLVKASSTKVQQDNASSPTSNTQSNQKRELHRELAYKQKIGQLLPKKSELVNVFVRRQEQQKRKEKESERQRHKTKLEEALAKQRQKIDSVNDVSSLASTSSSASSYTNEFEFVYHRIKQKNSVSY